MRTPPRTTLYLGVLVTALCLPAPSHAAQESTDSPVPSLPPVVVQGQVTATDLPPGSSTTKRKQLDERAIADWEDFAKRGDPSVDFSQQTKSVNIRGMDSDRVVILVDGIQVPWLMDGARGVKGGLRTIAFDTLSSIDVVRGAGAPRSGALTGVLALHTLDPDDLLRDGQAFGALVKSGYHSDDDSWNTQAALAGRIGPGTRWLLQAGRGQGHALRNQGRTGGVGSTRDKPDPLHYTRDNVLLKVQHAWRAGHQLSVTGEFFHHASDADALSNQGPDETYQPGDGSATEDLKRQRVMLGYAYQSRTPASVLDAGELKLYWQRLRLKQGSSGRHNDDDRANIIPGDPFRYGYPSGPYGRSNTLEQSTLGATTQWQGYLPGALSQHWAAGGTLAADQVRQHSSGEDNCPALAPGLPAPFGPRACDFLHTNQADMPEVRGLAWSLWAQDEIAWADGTYALTPALRFDTYRWSPQSGGAYDQNPNVDSGRLATNRGHRVSPSLRVSYQPLEDLTFHARYGYGFKAPNATQLYLNYGGPGTYLILGNPDLKPEISRGWELGVDAGNDDLGGRLTYFDNRYRDFIEEGVPVVPGSPSWQDAWATEYPFGVTRYANRDRVRIYGVELSGHWSVTSNWYTHGALAWSHGRDQDTGQHLNSVAPLKATFGLGYRTPQWGAEGLVRVAAARKKVEYPGATAEAPHPDFKAPGYGVVDLTGWWAPQAVRGLRVQAGVYNLFDRTYWNALDVPTQGTTPLPRALDYYTQPGRNLRVSLTYQY